MKLFIPLSILLLSTAICEGQIVNKSQTVGNTSKGNSEVLKVKVQNEIKALSTERESFIDEEVQEIFIVNKMAPAGVDINYLPLFGGFEKTEEQLIQDQFFLSDCDLEFPSRIAAAGFFNEMAWQYLNEGDRLTATHRFNLSYLLDSSYYDNFWGLGVIEFQEGNYSRAIDLMQSGLELTDGSNFVFMTDLATIYLKQAISTINPIYETGKARELLEKAIELQPNYSAAYTQMVVVKLLENQPEEAWNNFHQSLKLNPNELNREILAELLSRMDDPQGIFKKN